MRPSVCSQVLPLVQYSEALIQMIIMMMIVIIIIIIVIIIIFTYFCATDLKLKSKVNATINPLLSPPRTLIIPPFSEEDS